MKKCLGLLVVFLATSAGAMSLFTRDSTAIQAILNGESGIWRVLGGPIQGIRQLPSGKKDALRFDVQTLELSNGKFQKQCSVPVEVTNGAPDPMLYQPVVKPGKVSCR